MRTSTSRLALAGKAALLCVALATMSAPALADAVDISIPPQSLSTALREVARQCGIQVAVESALTAGKSAPALTGKYEPRDALALLLTGTGLEAYAVNGNTYGVRVKRSERDEKTSKATDDANALRLSQATSPAAGESRRFEDARVDALRVDLEEIIVTGTNIRGVQNNTAPLVVIGREEIDRSGYATTQQLIESLPQNFAGGATGPSETGIFGPGSSRLLNMTSASSVNLRGLGPTSTLTLLDGRRIASAAGGSAVDVSLIPLSAIDHIEFLTDGASAVYGSDAVAGVVNFVLRKDFDGADTRVRYGSATEGAPDETVVSQAFGRTWDTGSALVSAQYRHRDALPSAERDFASGAPQPTDLLPQTEDASLVLNARQDLTSTLDVFGQGTYTHKTSNRDHTTSGLGSVSYRQSAKTDHFHVAAGAGYEPLADWRFEAAASYSNEDDDIARLFAFGTPVGYPNGSPYLQNRFETWSADLKADGTLASLPGGALRVALGGTHRNERHTAESPWGATASVQRLDRDVTAGFAEVYVPLVGEANALALARRLELSAAVRYDEYSDFGGTTNPRVALYWSPLGGLGFRGAYSTSFRAPAPLESVTSAADSFVVNFPFARPGGGIAPVFVLSGGGAVLKPEEAENLTFGVEYRPPGAPNLRLSLDYYDIDFTDRITTPPFDTSALLHPDIYGPLLTTFASDAEAQAFLQAQTSQGALFVDPFGSGAVGVRNAYTVRTQNAARLRQSGFDLRIDYTFNVGANRFDANLNATMIDEILTSFTETSAATDIVDTYGNPLKYRARGSLTWSAGNWQTTGTVNYSDSYMDTTVAPTGTIDAWTTVDVSVRYTPAFIAEASVGLSVLNLFDADPPDTGNSFFPGIDYDVSNASPLGRFIAVELRKRW